MIALKHKCFFFLQACVKNIEFRKFDNIRTFLYRPFFGKLGKNVRICSGVLFKYPQEIFIENNGYIGNNCMIIGPGKVVIGKYALLGAGTKIISSYHETSNSYVPYCNQGILSKAVEIGPNVWTGFDVKILHGCIIGKNTIIGAGSILTPNSIFPNDVTLAGVPARIIKTR